MDERKLSEYQQAILEHNEENISHQRFQTGIAAASLVTQMAQDSRRAREHQEQLAAITAQSEAIHEQTRRLEAIAIAEAQQAASDRQKQLEALQQQADADEKFRWSQWIQTDHGRHYLAWETDAETFISFTAAQDEFTQTITNTLWAERDKGAPAAFNEAQKARTETLKEEVAKPVPEPSSRRADFTGLGCSSVATLFLGFLAWRFWWEGFFSTIFALVAGIAALAVGAMAVAFLFDSKVPQKERDKAYRKSLDERRGKQSELETLEAKEVATKAALKRYHTESEQLIGTPRGVYPEWADEDHRERVRAAQSVMTTARREYPSPATLPNVSSISVKQFNTGAIAPFLNRMQAETYARFFGKHYSNETLAFLKQHEMLDAEGARQLDPAPSEPESDGNAQN